MVLARIMRLTVLDAPSLRSMYVDKPMQDNGVIHVILRGRRILRDKPGSLAVGYLGPPSDAGSAWPARSDASLSADKHHRPHHSPVRTQPIARRSHSITPSNGELALA